MLDVKLAQIEIWFLERREGRVFAGLRFKTKRVSTRAGELNPQLAHLLALLSNPKESDVFGDPFAGYGAIPAARICYPYQKIICVEADLSRSDWLNDRFSDVADIEILSGDSLDGFSFDNKIDAIVTDPPWGLFDTCVKKEELYPQIITMMERVLKNGGRFVLLTAQKGLVDTLFANSEVLSVGDTYNILVSGKKVRVYVWD